MTKTHLFKKHLSGPALAAACVFAFSAVASAEPPKNESADDAQTHDAASDGPKIVDPETGTIVWAPGERIPTYKAPPEKTDNTEPQTQVMAPGPTVLKEELDEQTEDQIEAPSKSVLKNATIETNREDVN